MQDTVGDLEPIFVTVRKGCQITGLGATKIYELVGTGAIKSVKVGNRRLLEYQSLKALGAPSRAADS